MTHQQLGIHVPDQIGPGRQVAQLRQVLALVNKIAGNDRVSTDALEDGARLSSAYQDAPQVVRRRFDALTAETAAWAAIGVEALRAAREAAQPPRAAARQLARELERALRTVERLILG